ncbi:MAG TPA: hypothetical protein VG498_06230 [Terriglobales bacterium]|nr:hypothetical protein [Terriglobales bacterium]
MSPSRLSPWLLLIACLTTSQLLAQQQDAAITFKQVWKDAQPAEFSIVIHRNGQAEYVSQDKNLTETQEHNAPVESNAEQKTQSQDAASQDAFKKEFQVSDPVLQKVFSLAEKVNFFDGQFDFTKHAIAQTGRKTLSYGDANRHSSTTYNYSEDLSIQELTSVFQGISTTIEGGRKLDFDRRFDKLSLDRDLKALEEQSNEGRLYEVQAIAPTLQRVAADRTVLHIAQQRAERILKKAGLPVAPTNPQ